MLVEFSQESSNYERITDDFDLVDPIHDWNLALIDDLHSFRSLGQKMYGLEENIIENSPYRFSNPREAFSKQEKRLVANRSMRRGRSTKFSVS